MITDPSTTIEDNLALIAGLRNFQPKTKVIILAPAGAPDEMLSAPSVFFSQMRSLQRV